MWIQIESLVESISLPTMTKSINVAIIGSGVVGSAFIAQLNSIKSSIKYNVIYLARSSKEALYNDDYSTVDLATYKSASAKAVLPLSELSSYLSSSSKPTILVDNTSNESIAAYYPNFIKNGISIATPNKKAFSSDLPLWNSLFEGPGLVAHEATVGAGLPLIGPLNDLVATGDKIQKIEGILSGTLSYIFNKFSTTDLESLVKFSDVVNTAKELGYTEPDPRDDLNGLDVARKVTILARIAGFNVESPTSFPVESLIPKDLESASSASEFLEKLPNYDNEIEKIKQDALKNNQVLRFVGKVDFTTNKVSVEIGKYNFDHPFAALKGSDNVVSITSERYQNPLIIQGAGAGADVTAHGVLADVLKLGERLAN